MLASVFDDKCLIKVDRKLSAKTTRTSFRLIYYVLVVWHAYCVSKKSVLSFISQSFTLKYLACFIKHTIAHMLVFVDYYLFIRKLRLFLTVVSVISFPNIYLTLVLFRIDDQMDIIVLCVKNFD